MKNKKNKLMYPSMYVYKLYKTLLYYIKNTDVNISVNNNGKQDLNVT